MARRGFPRYRLMHSTGAKRQVVPGFVTTAQPRSKFALVGDFLNAVIARFSEPGVITAPPMITYYLLLSVFPLIIVIGNMLPMFGLTPEFALSYLNPVVPRSILNALEPAVIALLQDRSGSLLSFGIVTTLWTASRGFNAMRNAMNYAYGLPPAASTRQSLINFLGRRLFSFVITLGFVLALGVLMVLFIFGGQFLEWLTPILRLPVAWLATYRTLRWPVAVGAILVLTMMLYFLLPNARIRWWTIFPGTIVSTGGILLLSQGFSIYMRYFGTGWNSYGRIGTIMIVLLWINWSATIFVFGAVVNAITQEVRHGESEVSAGRIADLRKIHKRHMAKR
ncbi:MAG: YihY/virulence factor BrkB family protein [Schleiferilactobacillus perolens]|uniref:YihY/virulence factor BrkB family protein n=1 Tax=Schleiferilactobacillus perolens TaxID=100468 RepID=UPI0039EAB56E|nr:YihY/virulence factor BrkB family protein [Schleiferilactobacillus harbinensis]MCI1911580.1 YihY/virulence factor BrkB family protein [Schleiferilactobacillus harbinensis]